jgi:hypothetical protein
MIAATLLGFVTFAASAFGAVALFFGVVGAKGAPQEAAAAAIAIGLAVIPYVAFRVVQTLSQASEHREHQKEMLKLLRELVKERRDEGPATEPAHQGSDRRVR